jgi:hypothetical protein
VVVVVAAAATWCRWGSDKGGSDGMVLMGSGNVMVMK